MSADFDLSMSQYEIISKDDLEKCQREFKSGGVVGCRRFLEGKQEEWKNVPLNVAVIGNSGVGKSSFINAIRFTFNSLIYNLTFIMIHTTSLSLSYKRSQNYCTVSDSPIVVIFSR